MKICNFPTSEGPCLVKPARWHNGSENCAYHARRLSLSADPLPPPPTTPLPLLHTPTLVALATELEAARLHQSFSPSYSGASEDYARILSALPSLLDLLPPAEHFTRCVERERLRLKRALGRTQPRLDSSHPVALLALSLPDSLPVCKPKFVDFECVLSDTRWRHWGGLLDSPLGRRDVRAEFEAWDVPVYDTAHFTGEYLYVPPVDFFDEEFDLYVTLREEGMSRPDAVDAARLLAS